MKRNLIYCLLIAVLYSCKSKVEYTQPYVKCDDPVTIGYFRLIDKTTGEKLVFGAHAKISPDSIHVKTGVKDSTAVYLKNPTTGASPDFMNLPYQGKYDTVLIVANAKYYVLPVAGTWKSDGCMGRLAAATANNDPTVLVADSIGCVNIPFSLH